MKYLKLSVFSIIALSFILVKPANSQTPNKNPKDWKLVFQDDFNEDLDLDVWRIIKDYDHGGEPQMHTNRKKNARVENGSLIIECHKENYKNHDYTSAYVDLRKDYMYGFFEIRCKQPLGKGLWPAFWFSSATSTKDGWPPEIDVFETDGKDRSYYSGGVHAKENGSPTKTFAFTDHHQSIDEWHTYALEWDEEVLHWYVDDQLIASTTKDVPNMLRRLVLNLAIFSWDQPHKNANYFPARFEIDHIKIWERDGGCPEPNWKEVWLSQQASYFNDWYLSEHDQYISGDFTGDGIDEILMINASKSKASLYHFEGHHWESLWKTKENTGGEILEMRWGDRYYAGDFNGDGKEELLRINNAKGIVQIYGLNHQKWTSLLKNKDPLFAWEFHKKDKALVGDYDGDGVEELLLLNAENNQSKLYSFKNDQEGMKAVNGAKPGINDWNMDSGDQWIKGDFNGDGRDELFAIKEDANLARFYQYEDSKWAISYSNNNSGKIGSWHLNTDDIFLVGDYDNDGRDDLLFISPKSGHSRIYNADERKFNWTNHGNKNIYNWHLFFHKGDQVISGAFDPSGKSQLLVVRNSGVQNKSRSALDNSIKARTLELTICPSDIQKKESKEWKPSEQENPSGIIRVKK